MNTFSLAYNIHPDYKGEHNNPYLKNLLWNNIQLEFLSKLETIYWNDQEYFEMLMIHNPELAYEIYHDSSDNTSSIISMDELYRYLWRTVMKQSIEKYPSSDNVAYKKIQRWFEKAKWNERYDFIECLLAYDRYNLEEYKDLVREFTQSINNTLSSELSYYRIEGNKFVAFLSPEQKDCIDTIIKKDNNLVNQHLKKAIEFLNKNNADYSNSIKESISALESYCKTRLDEKFKDKALGPLLENIDMPNEFRKMITAMYGQLSGYAGIRHGNKDESQIDVVKFEDAKFFLHICTAFINMLEFKENIKKHEK